MNSPGQERSPAPTPAHAPEEAQISQRLVLMLAVATGISVANIYYAQPLLADIAHRFRASDAQAGLMVTLTQVGYAAGLALLVPLGDLLERRRLVVAVLLVAVAGLLGAAFSPSIGLLALFGIVIGLTSVVAQILVPFAADLAPDADRGRVVGTVMSGLLIGILLARTVSGVVAGLWSWRVMFVLAACLMLALSTLLWFTLPRRPRHIPMSYPALLGSVLGLLRSEPVLRRRALYGALGFSAFSIFWTTVAFLLARPPYGYGPAVIGAFGLVGAAGAIMASVAGRLADRGYTRGATGAFAAAIAISFLFLLIGGHNLVALIAGIILLDIGTQGLHITNQSAVYALSSGARSRITTAYMTSNFVGGAIGSAFSVALYSSRGWGGVCLLGGVVGALIVAVWLLELRSDTAPAGARTE